ncbi:hypothetical protein [Streptomyces zaomyceticus]
MNTGCPPLAVLLFSGDGPEVSPGDDPDGPDTVGGPTVRTRRPRRA